MPSSPATCAIWCVGESPPATRPSKFGRGSCSAGRDIFPLTDARHAFFGALTPAEPWLRMSEALARDGRSEDSIGILENAVRRYPRDPQLWIGLGNALVDHARSLTPPAELAF